MRIRESEGSKDINASGCVKWDGCVCFVAFLGEISSNTEMKKCNGVNFLGAYDSR